MTAAPASGARPDGPLYGAPAADAYRRFWQRGLVFTGRAGRAEYWWPVLVNAVIAAALSVLLAVIAVVGEGLEPAGSPAQAVTNALLAVLGVVFVALAVASIVPAIAVGVRRLHDADLSGWLVLVALIPSVGGIILAVLHVLPPSPRGQRYDRGAAGVPAPVLPPAATLPAPAPPAVAPAVAPAMPTGPIEVRPTVDPVTAPLPVEVRDRVAAAEPDHALRDAWTRIGAVAQVDVPPSAPPAWRRQGYLRVTSDDGPDVLATHGLSRGEGATALGPGAEVFIAAPEHAPNPGTGWRLAVLAAVANRIAVSGMHLPAELERYGTVSMTLPASGVPDAWRTAEGGLGVLVGLPVPPVPETVATAAGEVRLASVVPLTPEELQQILDGGAAARARIAGVLAALPPHALLTRA